MTRASKVRSKIMREAQHAAKSAVRSGLIAPGAACEVCGVAATDRPLHMHHWSYDPKDWLDVIPLCPRCHRGVHAGMAVEPRTGRRYRGGPSAGRVVAGFIKNRRKTVGRSLAEAGRIAGVSAPTMHRYETGARVPPIETSAALADALGVPESAIRPLIEAAWSAR